MVQQKSIILLILRPTLETYWFAVFLLSNLTPGWYIYIHVWTVWPPVRASTGLPIIVALSMQHWIGTKYMYW